MSVAWDLQIYQKMDGFKSRLSPFTRIISKPPQQPLRYMMLYNYISTTHASYLSFSLPGTLLGFNKYFLRNKNVQPSVGLRWVLLVATTAGCSIVGIDIFTSNIFKEKNTDRHLSSTPKITLLENCQ